MRFLSSAFLFAFLGGACFAQSPPLTRVSELETKVQNNPEDLDSRTSLLKYYSLAQSPENYTRHVMWLIENHPDYLAIDEYGQLLPQGGPLNTPSEYEQAKAAWETQLARPHNAGLVLLNAANFLKSSDPRRAVQLLEEARKLDTDKPLYVGAEADIYQNAVVRYVAGDLDADPLRSRLMNSSDAELLGLTGATLAGVYSPAGIKDLGLELLERAISLDPSNSKWKAVLESAKKPNSIPRRVFRIGGKVAEANLIEKVAPQYPAPAKQARVQGVVEFTMLIGEDGLVKNLQLVRGHPLLVEAARDAVIQWKYRPTFLNGNPVSVMTDVVISFTLDGVSAN
jgi:TonB family protein